MRSVDGASALRRISSLRNPRPENIRRCLPGRPPRTTRRTCAGPLRGGRPARAWRVIGTPGKTPASAVMGGKGSDGGKGTTASRRGTDHLARHHTITLNRFTAGDLNTDKGIGNLGLIKPMNRFDGSGVLLGVDASRFGVRRRGTPSGFSRVRMMPCVRDDHGSLPVVLHGPSAGKLP